MRIQQSLHLPACPFLFNKILKYYYIYHLDTDGNHVIYSNHDAEKYGDFLGSMGEFETLGIFD